MKLFYHWIIKIHIAIDIYIKFMKTCHQTIGLSSIDKVDDEKSMVFHSASTLIVKILLLSLFYLVSLDRL